MGYALFFHDNKLVGLLNLWKYSGIFYLAFLLQLDVPSRISAHHITFWGIYLFRYRVQF